MRTVKSYYELLAEELESDSDEPRPDDIEILLPPGQKLCNGCDD